VSAAQCSGALCVYSTVWRGTVCVQHRVECYCVCNAKCRDALFVYCTGLRGTVCVLDSLERHCVCTGE